jgi:eukaryotic-like serine/threonine-protein kinase
VSASTFPIQAAPTEERYETLRTLGQGGAGTVYLVRDRETGGLLALKKLLRFDPKSVLRLKREFRSIADMHHRNLVELYDLGASADGWFLTMEYVDGTDLLTHLHGSVDSAEHLHATRDLKLSSLRERSPADLGAVTSAFHQLASGIQALHRAGMLHRDLKPSNVMVANGRVVVLDFGLVRELDPASAHLTQDGTITGTPAYMAPEQAAGAALGEATDWYAFGVMLYQALCGELPVDGQSAFEILTRKTTTDPLPIEHVVSNLPRELVQLCNRLVARNPELRPSGDEVIRVLSGFTDQAPSGTARFSLDGTQITQTANHTKSSPLVGRKSELDQLARALGDSRDGVCVLAHVRGASGSGKTTLVQQFLTGVEESPAQLVTSEPLILRSRCNEREAMPYKALDGIVDSLVQYLLDLHDFDLGRLLPAEITDLAQLFPALQRLPSVRRLVESSRPRGEAVEVRIRGERALRELLANAAAKRPLVLWFDDLQWGDLDSTNILKSWPEQLASSPILLIYSYRREEMATSPCLRELLGPAQRPRTRQTVEPIVDLSGLPPQAVRELCERRLGSVALEHPELVRRIADESQGNPFLVSQLAALVQAKLARGDQNFDELSIEQLVDQATNLLAPEATRTLNVLAIAGRPLSPKTALRAAGVHTESRALLHSMRGLRLIRSRDTGDSQLLEVYHDRVREGVLASIDRAENQRTHAALLEALIQTPDADPGWLHALALGASQPSAALRYGAIAAERAETALAFERAIELYRSCISLSEPSTPEHKRLTRRLADCLSRAGHGVSAAEAYLEAAKDQDPDTAVRCKRLAASHFMRSGDFERGDRIVRDVLEAFKIRVPESEAALFAAIGWERAALAVRGLDFKLSTEPVDAMTSATIELYGTLALEYQVFDPVRTAWFQARLLRMALATGEPYRIARALCAAAIVTCVNGSPRAARETERILARASELERTLNKPALRAAVLSTRALTAYMLGRPRDIIEPAYEAEQLYRAEPGTEPSGDYYHRFAVVAVRIGGLVALGQYARATLELADAREEALVTRNQNALLQLSLVQTVLDGVHNRMESAKARLLEEREFLPRARFGPLHTLHMVSVMRVACGTHDYAWAEPWLEQAWEQWKKSIVRRSAFMNLLAYGARLRYLVNRHVVERRTENLEDVLRADLKAASRTPFEEGRKGIVARTRARIAFMEGRREEAASLLRLSIDAIERGGAPGEAARERYGLAFMIGGDEGRAMAAECDRLLREAGVVDPLAEVWSSYPELRGCSFG